MKESIPDGIAIGQTLVERKELVPVSVLNLSNTQKVLKKGTVIARYQKVTTVINYDPQEDDNVNFEKGDGYQEATKRLDQKARRKRKASSLTTAEELLWII